MSYIQWYLWGENGWDQWEVRGCGSVLFFQSRFRPYMALTKMNTKNQVCFLVLLYATCYRLRMHFCFLLQWVAILKTAYIICDCSTSIRLSQQTGTELNNCFLNFVIFVFFLWFHYYVAFFISCFYHCCHLACVGRGNMVKTWSLIDHCMYRPR